MYQPIATRGFGYSGNIATAGYFTGGFLSATVTLVMVGAEVESIPISPESVGFTLYVDRQLGVTLYVDRSRGLTGYIEQTTQVTLER